ncbi:hypothetical protein N1027_15495 [Herbiconiux sp. CPCC 205763]|uniref:Uncharacterized protein n=1 Tax=Herbiconiux aconitum TaxID=2970913 RepID=A0ABT2GX67_9MICO|nr:hypothetical protein [Herbiconiux aconitum]MCS5719539.1 hypothetical protein [Herbiconiux aconitum]
MSTPPPHPGQPAPASANPVPAPYPGPVRPGDKRPITAVLSLVLGVIVFGGTLVAKLGAAAVTDTPDGVLSTLGAASFLSLLLIVPAIVLGHLAVSSTGKSARVGRGMAVGALVLAYVDLVLFVVRLLAAAIATAVLGDASSFFYNLFFWV